MYAPFRGLFRRFRAWVLDDTPHMIGECRFCGACCKQLILLNGGSWVRSSEQFYQLCEEAPEYERFEFDGDSDNGCLSFRCTRLGEDNFCTDYEERPSVCRTFPSITVFYQGGGINPYCGFSIARQTFRDAWYRKRRKKSLSFSATLHDAKEKEKE